MLRDGWSEGRTCVQILRGLSFVRNCPHCTCVIYRPMGEATGADPMTERTAVATLIFLKALVEAEAIPDSEVSHKEMGPKERRKHYEMLLRALRQ